MSISAFFLPYIEIISSVSYAVHQNFEAVNPVEIFLPYSYMGVRFGNIGIVVGLTFLVAIAVTTYAVKTLIGYRGATFVAFMWLVPGFSYVVVPSLRHSFDFSPYELTLGQGVELVSLGTLPATYFAIAIVMAIGWGGICIFGGKKRMPEMVDHFWYASGVLFVATFLVTTQDLGILKQDVKNIEARRQYLAKTLLEQIQNLKILCRNDPEANEDFDVLCEKTDGYIYFLREQLKPEPSFVATSNALNYRGLNLQALQKLNRKYCPKYRDMCPNPGNNWWFAVHAGVKGHDYIKDEPILILPKRIMGAIEKKSKVLEEKYALLRTNTKISNWRWFSLLIVGAIAGMKIRLVSRKLFSTKLRKIDLPF